MAATTGFELHPRLAADTLPLGETRLCLVRLMNDSTWPWVLLIPRRAGIREIHELSEQDQHQLLRESSLVGRRLLEIFQGDKLNLGALGNLVPQLHLHHIVRHEGDPAWPDPVWGRQPAVPYGPEELERMLARLAPVVEELAGLQDSGEVKG